MKTGKLYGVVLLCLGLVFMGYATATNEPSPADRAFQLAEYRDRNEYQPEANLLLECLAWWTMFLDPYLSGP